MEQTLVGFLGWLSSTVFWVAVTVLVIINGMALAAFLATRSRRLVDQWTPRLVAADALLLGVGLGIPLVSGLAKLGIHALATMLGSTTPPTP